MGWEEKPLIKSVIYDNYVKFDRFRYRSFLSCAPTHWTFSPTIKSLHFQNTLIFCGMLVAFYLVDSVQTRSAFCKIWTGVKTAFQCATLSLNGQICLTHELGNTFTDKGSFHMLGTILIVVVILMLLGALPTWPHSRQWGYYPSGGLGLVLVILVILLLLGRL